MSKQDLEFMSELDAASHMQESFAAKTFLLAITTLVFILIIGASFSEIDERTRGQGQVVPTKEIQVVQSLEGGILAELLVSAGDLVEKDQVLMRISDVQFASEERGVESRFAALKAKKARLTAESKNMDFVMPADIRDRVPAIVDNELALFNSRREELENALAILADQQNKAEADVAETKADMKRITNSRGLLYQELKITNKMVAQRAVPELDAIRLRREISDLSGQLNVNEEKLVGLDADLSATERQLEDQRDKFRSQALGELGEVESEIAQLQENLTSIGDRVDRTELRAPIKGIVNNVALTTIGGVVEPAHKLIEIVPVDDELKIIARVLPNDIAFIKPGQPAKIKITAYDAQRYGSLDGELKRIGANSVTDREGNVFFEIEVRTDKNYLGTAEKPLPITPGMVAEVEIITGRRTIMEYLLKPVLRIKDRAFSER